MKHFVVIQSEANPQGWIRRYARNDHDYTSQGNPEYRHCMAAYFWGCSLHFEDYLSCDVPTYAIDVKDTSLQLLLPCLLQCGFGNTSCLTFLHLIRHNRWMYFRDESTVCNHTIYKWRLGCTVFDYCFPQKILH